MSFSQSFRLALKALSTSKMRALLTMLGIIIGVAAVIIIISLGDGVNAMINEEFNKMGSNLIQVYDMGRGGSVRTEPEDMYALVDEYPGYLRAVSPVVSVSGAKLKADGEVFSSTVTGVGEDYLTIKSFELTQGRFLQYIDVARMQNVCVIGSYVDSEYFNGAGYGQVLRVNGVSYTVVGVLAESAENTSYGEDNAVYLPYTNAGRINGSTAVTQYDFSAVSEEVSTQAKGVIEALLEKTYAQDEDEESTTYMVISMSEMMTVMGDITGTVMTALVAIAAISLLVGGIGIMNIMLVSVTERTREIGIRKSLGAKRRDIRSQFLIEAATTSALGGVLGIILGMSLAGLVGPLVGVTAVPSLTAILISFGVSAGVGMLFGYLPANKAASLNPIDALRYD